MIKIYQIKKIPFLPLLSFANWLSTKINVKTELKP